MAALTGTTNTYGLTGLAEDVHDVIYDISPTETPVMTMAKRLTGEATTHEWQTDALASASVNKAIEGDDATFATVSATTMLSNRMMISQKTVMISGTADRVKKYGRAKEIAYQITKKGKELKRDIETAMVGMQGSSVGGAATARQAAGLRAMITNYRAASGTGTNTTATVPGYSSSDWGLTAADGTAVTFVEADLKAALELAWTDGGDPSMIVTNSKQKQRMSAFAGASAFQGFSVDQGRSAQGAVIAGVDLYVSDFGDHKVVLDRFIGQTGVLCLDPEYVGIAWLRPIKDVPLAKTGDAEKRQLICEWTTVAMNPDAHAQIVGAVTT
jgi:hypothetical protein